MCLRPDISGYRKPPKYTTRKPPNYTWMQQNPGFIVYLEPSKFKAGDMMSKLIRNTIKYVSVNTILQTLNVSVRYLAKISCSSEVSGALTIPGLLLSMQKITSVLSNQLPRTGLLNIIFSYSSLFPYSLKVSLRNGCKKKLFSGTQQRALTFITYCKMSNLGV